MQMIIFKGVKEQNTIGRGDTYFDPTAQWAIHNIENLSRKAQHSAKLIDWCRNTTKLFDNADCVDQKT